ncbi:MAG: hypothetical protein M3069_20400, partial [Chloroflexota bacterium]|nr:hypothetical protein [Chloroflexota bacterium]
MQTEVRMDDAHDAEPEHSPYVRLPWPLVASGLAGVLLLALAAGLLANRYMRPQLALQPTPNPPAAAPAAPTSPSATAVGSITTPLPVATAVTEEVATAPSAVVASPTVPATPTTVSPTSTTPSPTPSALPTVEPILEEEVGKAYELFWRVRSQALLELDTTHLGEVMDGDYLANVAQRIETLRAEGRAIKTHVVLNYSVISATPEQAEVVDDFQDNSIYVNIGTEDPQTIP